MAFDWIEFADHRKHEKHALPLAIRSGVFLKLPPILRGCKFRDKISKNNGREAIFCVI